MSTVPNYIFFEFLEHCDAILECFLIKMSTVRVVMYLKWGFCVPDFNSRNGLNHWTQFWAIPLLTNLWWFFKVEFNIQRPKPKLPNFWKTRFITIYLSQTTRTGGSYITSYYHMHNQQKYHDIPTKTISQENYVIFRRWFSTMS